MNFNSHFLIGFVWPVMSSRTGEVYKVEMTDQGFHCNCIAGTMRRKCKHAKSVLGLLTSEDEDPQYDIY